MILPLRQRHRHVFALLGVALPLAFVVGIAAQRPVPNVAALPAGLATAPGRFTTPVWQRNDLFAKSPVQVRLVRETGRDGFGVSCSATKDFIKPDLLVYWAAGNVPPGSSLPANATLLGTFGTGVLPLPSEAETTTGMLVLFSLADQEIVEVSKPFKINPEGGAPRRPNSN